MDKVLMDVFFLNRCFCLAERAYNYTLPNPKVGALVVNEWGKVIAEGWHKKYGEPHAEVNAILELPDDFNFSNCTLYVSLEPCCHTQKKTPPCTHLILEKKIPKVVIATLDPNPEVQGKGIQILRDAGIEVILYHDHFIKFQKAINAAFYINQQYQRPLITLKWAESINRVIGDCQKRIGISHPYTQFFTHALRAQHQAILVGKKTVLIDKPQLNLRYAIGKNPLIILLDTYAELNPEKFFPGREGIVINQKESKIEGNWRYWKVENIFEWKNYVSQLYTECKIGSILVEGGSKVLNSILRSNVWDFAYVIKSDHLIETENPVWAPEWNPIQAQLEQEIKENKIYKIVQNVVY